MPKQDLDYWAAKIVKQVIAIHESGTPDRKKRAEAVVWTVLNTLINNAGCVCESCQQALNDALGIEEE